MRGDNCRRWVSFSRTGSLAGALLQKLNDLADDLPLLLVLMLHDSVQSANASKARQYCHRGEEYYVACASRMAGLLSLRAEAHRSHDPDSRI